MIISISYEVLLEKMQEEINKARHANETSTKRAHLYTVKTLAELGIGGEELKRQVAEKPDVPKLTTPLPQHTPSKPMSVAPSEPIRTEDGSNGSSIFDF